MEAVAPHGTLGHFVDNFFQQLDSCNLLTTFAKFLTIQNFQYKIMLTLLIYRQKTLVQFVSAIQECSNNKLFYTQEQVFL